MSIKNNTTSLQEVLDILATKASGGEQVAPEISVSSNGLITATAGTKSSTYQLAFQSAKTITPSTVSQIAVSSGYYTGGNITVAGDSNLVSGNIKSGVSIFGVSGTAEVGGETVVDDVSRTIIDGTIKEVSDDKVQIVKSYIFQNCTNLTTVSFPACTSIGNSAFKSCSSLTTVSFPVCTYIGSNAFNGCSSLTTVSFPVCQDIEMYAFGYCSNLTSVSFPACKYIETDAFQCCSNLTTVSFPACTRIGTDAFQCCSNLTTVSFPACRHIGNYAFASCSSLTTASFPVCTSIHNNAFKDCYTLSSLTLGASSVCDLTNSNAFSTTPFAGYSTYFSGTPHIYVPAALINAYQSATNWVYFSSYFSTIEIGGGDSGGSVDLIAFAINNTMYTAERGMIWSEWCDTEYNTLGLYSDGYDITKKEGIDTLYIYTQDYEDGLANSPIVENYGYILSV